MKAIKIPNTALLDVFGRPVAINHHDLRRQSIISYPTYTTHVDKNASNNHNEVQNNNSTATALLPKLENPERLTVIGQ